MTQIFATNVWTGQIVPIELRHVHPGVVKSGSVWLPAMVPAGHLSNVSRAERARAVSYMEAHPDWLRTVKEGVDVEPGLIVPVTGASLEEARAFTEAQHEPVTTPIGGGRAPALGVGLAVVALVVAFLVLWRLAR